MKTKRVQIISDPGHAWAKVKIKELEKLNIAHKISEFSYMRGEYAYLEEDCDLGLYVEALRANKIEPSFKGKGSNRSSRVRGYYRYFYKRENAKDFIVTEEDS